MTDIKLTAETLRYIALFEKVTRARVKDCVEESDRLTFVVHEDELGKAIGRGASNLKRLRELMDTDVEVVGYSDDKTQFIQNIFHKFDVQEISFDTRKGDEEVVRVKVDPRAKGRAIGKGGRNVDLARQLAARHHDIDDIVVE